MRILLIFSLSFIVLSGCDSTNVQPEPQISPDEKASNLLNQGQYGPAAIEFLRLSELYPEQAEIYQLKAVDAFINDANLDAAQTTIENIVLPETQQELIDYREILAAGIALLLNQPKQALLLTDKRILENVNPWLLLKLYEIRANSFASLKEFYSSSQELIKLDNLLNKTGEQSRFTNRIWNYLVNTDLELLNRPVNRDIDKLAAWTELAFISKSLMTRTAELRNALELWKEYNPGHPANNGITSEILMTSERFDSRPEKIALLLPLSGIYERYSERIRDGFLSAWFYESNYKPEIQIYNTDTENFPAVYQQAVSDGAGFIVGPLEKESVRILAELENIPVRTLALNQVEVNRNGADRNTVFPLPELVQFGLPPEDEARQVAQRGILEGFNRVLIVSSADDYGNRVVNAFSDEWLKMGGTILERVDYDTESSDFVSPIKKLLNIDSSENRINALRQKLGRNLSTNSRLREDIEFVFMVATNLNARQIVPHLRFFRAEGIPIYTISSVYTGKQNPQVDSDLNGVEFIDIPWLLGPELHSSNISAQIQRSWQSSSSVFPRYYAFGVDAFRLIAKIGELALKRNYRYRGETGALYMTADGVIHRNLLWARFNNGIPESIHTGTNP
jgi:uncharacterized protein